MANPSRFNPVEDLFNEITQGFLVRPLSSVARGAMPQAELQIRIDVKEDERSYRVLAELPGVRKEDIHVDIEGARVSLQAEVRAEQETRQGEKTVYSERSYGLVRRSFDLPADVEPDGASAEYRDGVLTLTLPKKAGGRARRVNIS